MGMTNTLAFYNTATIMTVKSFRVSKAEAYQSEDPYRVGF
jgi:hypothetical protein